MLPCVLGKLSALKNKSIYFPLSGTSFLTPESRLRDLYLATYGTQTVGERINSDSGRSGVDSTWRRRPTSWLHLLSCLLTELLLMLLMLPTAYRCSACGRQTKTTGMRPMQHDLLADGTPVSGHTELMATVLPAVNHAPDAVFAARMAGGLTSYCPSCPGKPRLRIAPCFRTSIRTNILWFL